MAARRGKSQARRNNGNSGGLPGWAWMVLGIVLTIVVVLAAPKYLKSDGGDGFFRPKPNPDAQPAAASDGGEEAIVPEGSGETAARPAAADADKPKGTQYDFYTLLPADEVAMSDAELAATARAEAARRAASDASVDADQATAATATTITAATPASAATAPAATGNDTPYILQAGAFGASGDAEAVKARIALLGLSARVESASIDDKTVYRVRMGPYGTASELADAKRKLANGGLPALAIKAK
ncbi:SPOR domain-containing protein [Luteimonas sp. 50]|uniref:SPOR domain-containing protein n=1 Tax=Cognatiluteimonas sedimenti TaxID=2927791 RepID=A0ABT0A5B7_9GAMM|nr:SPOR domain-containing protein [Lysobacter sedimenti]MCJ0826171.1 SPOR domain-containing protein [Lysobacter sedimenti]